LIEKPKSEGGRDRARFGGYYSAFLIGGIGVLAAAAVLALGFVFTRRLIDFPVYYSAGQSLISGRTDLYAADFARGPLMDYRYPPFFLVALIPLWHLPYGLAAYLWYLVSLLCIAGCVYSLGERLGKSSMPQASGAGTLPGDLERHAQMKAWAVALLTVGPYFVMELHYGNAELVSVALLFVGLALAMRGKDLSAALMVALSITIKVAPILMLPYFVLKRRWKLSGLILALLIGLNLLPAAYFGFKTNTELVGAWSRHVILDQGFHEANGPINLSLKGQLNRYLTNVDYSQRLDGDTNYPAVNIASFQPKTVATLWLVLDGVLSVAVFAFLLRRPSGAMSIELGVMVCWMLIAEPLTSKIYFIALLWPVAALAHFAWRRTTHSAHRLRWILAGLAAINLGLPLIPGRLAQRFLLVVGTDFYLTCFLLVLLVWVLMSPDRYPPAADGVSQMKGPPTAKGPSKLLHHQN
jgi:hypothetical protein